MQTIAAQIIEQAKKQGADTADAIVVRSSSLSTGWRQGKPEEIERAESLGLGLRVMIGQRQASVASTDLSKDALATLVERAVAMAKAAPADPYLCLADEALLARSVPDLSLADQEEPSAEALMELSRIAEESALAVDGVTNSGGGSAGAQASEVALVTSHGFMGGYRTTSYSLSTTAVAGEGTGMERDYDYSSTRMFRELGSAEAIGKEAAARALKRLGSRKMPTCQVPVVLDPRVGRGLLGQFLGAISGSAIARGTSFLKDSLGKAVFAPQITIMDDPLKPKGLGSRPFDGEGVAGKAMKLVDGGLLTTWLLDSYTAKKLRMATTGHASRGLSSPPSPGSTNSWIVPGDLSPEDLMADIKAGFYVTDTFGMGVNLVTGDYSQGAVGFWIENGKISFPVSEVTIAGHLNDMFAHLTPANDLEWKSRTNTPTLRIDGMTVAGG